jgi:hypothetical protein
MNDLPSLTFDFQLVLRPPVTMVLVRLIVRLCSALGVWLGILGRTALIKRQF